MREFLCNLGYRLRVLTTINCWIPRYSHSKPLTKWWEQQLKSGLTVNPQCKCDKYASSVVTVNGVPIRMDGSPNRSMMPTGLEARPARWMVLKAYDAVMSAILELEK